jgi:hypothetical protein
VTKSASYTVLWNRNHLLRFRSDFGKVSVPSAAFQQKNWTKYCLLSFRSSIVPQKVGLSFLIFCLFDNCIEYYVGSKSNSGSGTGIGMNSGYGSTMAKRIRFLQFQFHNTVHTRRLTFRYCQLDSESNVMNV